MATVKKPTHKGNTLDNAVVGRAIDAAERDCSVDRPRVPSRYVVNRAAGLAPLKPAQIAALQEEVRRWLAGEMAALVLPPGCSLVEVRGLPNA